MIVVIGLIIIICSLLIVTCFQLLVFIPINFLNAFVCTSNIVDINNKKLLIDLLLQVTAFECASYKTVWGADGAYYFSVKCTIPLAFNDLYELLKNMNTQLQLSSSDLVAAELLELAPLNTWILLNHVYPDLAQLNGPIGHFFYKIAVISASFSSSYIISGSYSGVATIYSNQLAGYIKEIYYPLYEGYFSVTRSPYLMQKYGEQHLSLSEFNELFEFFHLTMRYLNQTSWRTIHDIMIKWRYDIPFYMALIYIFQMLRDSGML